MPREFWEEQKVKALSVWWEAEEEVRRGEEEGEG